MLIKRLALGERESAKQLFSMMADVFGKQSADLSDRYLDNLLGQEGFWAIAVFDKSEVVGGLTAHIIPMTIGESTELFIYDVAVRQSHRRQGVGRRLLMDLRERARTAGIVEIFVLADNYDLHALDFYRGIGGRDSPATLFTLLTTS